MPALGEPKSAHGCVLLEQLRRDTRYPYRVAGYSNVGTRFHRPLVSPIAVQLPEDGLS